MGFATNPFVIGTVTITGTKKSFATEFPSTDIPDRINALFLESYSENNATGSIFVGDSTLDIATAAPTGIIVVVSAGQRETLGGVLSGNRLDWRKYYVDGDVPGDMLLVSGQVE